MENFAPYIEYVNDNCKTAHSLYQLPEGEDCINYNAVYECIHKNKHLIPLIANVTNVCCLIAKWVLNSIEYGLYEDMFEIYKLMLLKPCSDFNDYFNAIEFVISGFVGDLIYLSKNERYYEENDGYCETDKNFGIFLNEIYYPFIKKLDNKRLQNKLQLTDKSIDKYYVEDEETLNKIMQENRIRDGYNEDYSVL